MATVTLADESEDGLDSLLRELALQPSPTASTTASPRTTTPSTTRMTTATTKDRKIVQVSGDWNGREHDSADKEAWPRGSEIDETRIAYFQGQLREYIQDLADPFILQEIEDRLTSKSYKTLASYYEGKPEMAKYTLDHEVARMVYRVIDSTATEKGGAAAADCGSGALENDCGSRSSSITPAAITYKISPAPSLLLADNDPPSIHAAHAMHPHIFSWRLANQSLFAELLQEIQLRFIRADLEIGVVSKDSRFVLDVGRDSLEGVSMFHVLLAAAEEGAVEVARVEGIVSVDVRKESWTQKVRLVKLQPVFDDVLRGVAEALARHEGDGRGGDGGREGGRWWGVTRRVPLSLNGLREVGQGLLQAVTTVGRMIEDAATAADEEEGGREERREGGGRRENNNKLPKTAVTRAPPKWGYGMKTDAVEGGREEGEEEGVRDQLGDGFT